MHTDVSPDAAGSGMFGWLLCMLGQDVGFPVPRGRCAASWPQALACAALTSRGGAGRCGRPVDGGDDRQAAGPPGVRDWRTARPCGRDGGARRRAGPGALPRPGRPTHPLPARLRRDLDRFQWDDGTIKVNWALDRTRSVDSRRGGTGAGTVHLGVDQDGFVDFAADLTRRAHAAAAVPAVRADDDLRPDALARRHRVGVGLHARAARPRVVGSGSPTRRRAWRTRSSGWRPGSATARSAPRTCSRRLTSSRENPSLVGGAINAGTAGLHQQLVFRPTPGLGRPETPVPGLYLAGASAHPGGGVHGACGWNAARAALGANGRLTGGVRRVAGPHRVGPAARTELTAASVRRRAPVAALGEVGEPTQRLDVARPDGELAHRLAGRGCPDR